MNIIIEAARLAAKFHENQKRKHNGKPYITHPLRVAGRVMIHPEATEAMVAAGALHDSEEDYGTTLKRIEEVRAQILKKCGTETLELVKALTNPSKKTKFRRAERKRIDREHLKTCNRQVKITKLIDRIDNLNELITDIQTNTFTDREFGLLYAHESELLLEEALTNIDTN